jgi:cation diffusion facilitator CzcD-associated flavoprotein CzcO
MAIFLEPYVKAKTTVVTDHIDRFTANGIVLESGKTLVADIIITATGLDLVPGRYYSIGFETFTLQFLCLQGVNDQSPNFLFFCGYTNASWTLKSDLTSEYISRMLFYLENTNIKQCKQSCETNTTVPLLNLNSGYILRAAKSLPSQGNKAPWRCIKIMFWIIKC